MRTIKAIIAVFLAIVFGSWASFCAAKQEPDTGTEQTEPNDLSAYYGFGEMEIIKLDWGIRNLRVADFDGDGRNDIAVVNNKKANIELLIQQSEIKPSEKTVAVNAEDVDINQIVPLMRFEKQSVAVSQRVFSFACGDLNTDGMVDLVFYGDPRGLYVMLQKAGEKKANESKTLSWRTRKKIKIDDGLETPNGLVCADLNNDKRVDLALAGRDSVYIILQKEDGSLAEPVKYPTTAQIRGIEVSDLNGDNINDLVLITSDSEKPVHVRFGLKTGQLGPQVQLFIENPAALEFYNIDGKVGDEVLTIESRSKRLICYELATEKDDADWPILFYPLAAGEENTKRDLAVGDFDGDGLADIAISDPGAAELIFYKQIAGLGLAEPVRFPAFADIESLSAADINGDGRPELGALSVKEKVIGLSKLEDERLTFPKPINVSGEPVAMELADVDGDGEADCVYISKDANDVRNLRVIYNIGSAADELLKSGKSSKHKKMRLAEKTGESEPPLALKGLVTNPEGLKVFDVDQDGLQDVLIFVQYEFPILVHQTQKRKFEVVSSPTAQSSLIKEASLKSIATANVDGKKGEELLIAQKNFARSLTFLKGESWNIIDQYNAKSTENNITAAAAFDIEGKGAEERPAILLLDGQKGQLQILKAGADKTYRFEKELNAGKWGAVTHLKMLFAPLGGSKATSILLFDSEKFALITPPSSSNTPQYLEQQFSYETKIKDGKYGNLTAGDINSDGRCDIIMVDYERKHIEILALDAEIKPIPAMRFKLFEEKSYHGKESAKVSIEPRELKIADVTGDGKADLVTVIHDRIIIYPQD